MRSTQERIARLHARAKELERARDKRRLYLLGGASSALLIALVSLVSWFSGRVTGRVEGFTASSLLGESAGGYVLTAVVAFMIGTVVTVLLIWWRQKGTVQPPTPESSDDEASRQK